MDDEGATASAARPIASLGQDFTLCFRVQRHLGVHSRYGLHTRAVTVFRDTLSEGFSHFVTSIAAPVASGWSGCRVGFAPTGKRRLFTAHANSGHYAGKAEQHSCAQLDASI